MECVPVRHHSEFMHNGLRSHVFGKGQREHSLERKTRKREFQERIRRFLGVAFAPVRIVEHEEDFCFLGIFNATKTGVPHDRVARLIEDGINRQAALRRALLEARNNAGGPFGRPYASRNKLHDVGLGVNVGAIGRIGVPPLPAIEPARLKDPHMDFRGATVTVSRGEMAQIP